MGIEHDLPNKKRHGTKPSRSGRVLTVLCGCAIAGASLGLLFLGVLRYFGAAPQLAPILVLPSMLVWVRLLCPHLRRWLNEA